MERRDGKEDPTPRLQLDPGSDHQRQPECHVNLHPGLHQEGGRGSRYVFWGWEAGMGQLVAGSIQRSAGVSFPLLITSVCHWSERVIHSWLHKTNGLWQEVGEIEEMAAW